MERLTEAEYIAAYGRHVATPADEVEAARAVLRDAAFNKAYIPPTNADAVFRDLARHYERRLAERTAQLVSARREVTSLKRAAPVTISGTTPDVVQIGP